MLLFFCSWGILDFLFLPYTRVSLGCQTVLILVSSSRWRYMLSLVSPSLSFLKGVAKLKNLQDEVSYVLDCAAEAWWYPKMWEKLSLNEVWLKVQGKFIQDHQDFGRATREAFKLVWIKNLQDIFTKLVLSWWYPRWNENWLWLGKVLSLRGAKLWPMS